MRGNRRGAGLALLAAVTLLAWAVTPTAGAAVPGERRFAITARRFAFEPDRVEVEQGDHVTLVLHSADTTHGLEIESYGVKLRIPKGGAPVSVDFVADRVGEFPFKCSKYCGSGHRRMKGVLVVRARPQ